MHVESQPIWDDEMQSYRRLLEAVAANNTLFVAGHWQDENGNYVRSSGSTGCIGIDDGCIWAPFSVHHGQFGASGTSISAPLLASALASVLAVFPDTTHQNLAKFAKACALKAGNGTRALLRQSGGVGVADFTCMGGVTQALAQLPIGGRTNVYVNGQNVSVGGRDVTLSFAPSHNLVQGLRLDRESGFSLNFVPTGDNTVMLVVTGREGDLFASGSVGTEDNFFGFTLGHDQVTSFRIAFGHENVFAHLAEMRSDGGKYIDSAVGRSLGFTLRAGYSLTQNTSATVSLQTEKFLGGHAKMRPFGDVELNEGGWNHRVDLTTTKEIGKAQTLDLSAGMYFPDSGEREASLGAQYKLAF